MCFPVLLCYRLSVPSYVPIYRLTSAEYRSAGLTAGSTGEFYRYTYDAVGNRVQLTRDGGRVTSYEYDAANRLTSVNGVVYTWDAHGNLLSDGRAATATTTPTASPRS